MADFSAQSASLQAPSSAGDQPVVTPKVSTPPSAVPQALNSIVDLLGKGVDNYYNVQMQKAKIGILGNISQAQGAINSAVATGQMTPQEAQARSMAKYNESLAAYPQLASDIMGLNAAFKATTQTGNTDQIIKNQQDEAQKVRDQQDSMAIGQGYHLDSSMSEQQRGAIIAAAEGNVMAQRQLAQKKAQVDFDQSQTKFTQEQQDRQNKQDSFDLINTMASNNMTAVNATIQSLQDDVNAGRKTPQQAQLILNQQQANINGPLQSAARLNPELAAPFKQLFDQQFQLGQKLLDPAARSEDLQRQFNDSVTRQKLAIMSKDPQVGALVATSQMLGTNNSLLMATNAQATVKAMAGATSTPTANGVPSQYVPQIAGNPEVEADALKGLKYGIDQLRGGKYADAMAGNQEGSNAVNNLLSQTGQLLNQGATPDKLKGLADFFGSSQYAYMMQHGQIDPVAAQAAKKTFQMLYQPAIVQAVGSRMQGSLPNSTTHLSDAVDVNFTGAGVSFTPKKGLSATDMQSAQASIDSLKSAAQGLNSTVRIGAHMEGTTDYQKYWDDNKYYLLPQVYPVKPGQVVNGYKWSGTGDFRDKSTWSKVGGQ